MLLRSPLSSNTRLAFSGSSYHPRCREPSSRSHAIFHRALGRLGWFPTTIASTGSRAKVFERVSPLIVPPETPPLLHVVIPLRSRQVSPDFGRVSAQLRATIASVRAGASVAECRILIVGHDLPELDFAAHDVEFMSVEFAPPRRLPRDAADIEALTAMRADKGRKILVALDRLRQTPRDYFMCLDADDLLSSRLLTYLRTERPAHGCYFERGYKFDLASPLRIFPRRRFFHECGSSFVLRIDAAPFPHRLDLSLGFSDKFIRRYDVHAYVPQAMADAGKPLQALPFPGAIYVVGGQNFYANMFRRRYPRILTQLRNFTLGHRLTPALASEFSLGPYLDAEHGSFV